MRISVSSEDCSARFRRHRAQRCQCDHQREQKSACHVHSTPLHLPFCRYDRALKAVGDRRCKTRMILIPLGGAALVSIQAKSLRSQALHLVFKRFSFLSQSCVLGFFRIGGAQFFQGLFNRELGCFSHGKTHIQETFGQWQPRQSKPVGTSCQLTRRDGLKLPAEREAYCFGATASDPSLASVDLDQQELCRGNCSAPNIRRSLQAGNRPSLHSWLHSTVATSRIKSL